MGVALVTGTSTGIGSAIALRLAREGHTVHGSVRSEASGEALLEAADGLDLQLVVMDVDDDDSVERGVGSVLEERGRIDILVNNAGISGGLAAVEDTSVSTFESVYNTNVLGGVRCIRAALPGMRERGEGAIVNITSAAGRKVFAAQGAYAASKHAMEAVTEALAAEVLPFGVRVAAVEPGVVVTPIFEKPAESEPPPDSPYAGPRRMMGYFMGALGGDPAVPEDVADVVMEFLTADEPKLRYTVGADSARMAERRPDFTDEEWVAAQATDDDEAWWAFTTDVSGVTPPG